MEYFVIAPDGKEYGPAGVDMLKRWAGEGRVEPQTSLKERASGEVVSAASITGLFDPTPPPAISATPPSFSLDSGSPNQAAAGQPTPNWQQPPSPYYRGAQGQQPPPGAYFVRSTGKAELIRSLIYSVAGLMMFFLIHGFGLIWGGYAVYYAVRAKALKHQYATVMLVVSILCLGLIVAGWVFRLSPSTAASF